MSKLLRANFMRLKKDKVFWLCIVAVFAIGIFNMLNTLRRVKGGLVLEDGELDRTFFGFMPTIGLFMSVVISLFVGTEYSDGTMRNKLIVGCTRSDIYLSTIITNAAASVIVNLIWFSAELIMLPLLGSFKMTLIDLLLNVLVALLTSIALSAVFSLIGMSCTNKAGGVVIAILTAFLLVIIGSSFYNSLLEPETIRDMKITADGLGFTDPYSNPDYIGGPLRTIFQAGLFILPTGQQILLANLELSNPWMCMGLSIIVTIVITAFGMILYRKKDLK